MSQGSPTFLGRPHLPGDPPPSWGSPTFLGLPHLARNHPTSCVSPGKGRNSQHWDGAAPAALALLPVPTNARFLKSSHIRHYSWNRAGLGFVFSAHPQSLLSKGIPGCSCAPRESLPLQSLHIQAGILTKLPELIFFPDKDL